MRDVEFELSLPESMPCEGWASGEYGSFIMASRYCGFRRAVRQCPGTWQHGWMPKHFNIDVEMVVGTHGRARDELQRGCFFVARQDQVEFLRSVGARSVVEVGLPIVYTAQANVDREENSLLVVPVHSGSNTTHSWDFESYADAVSSIRPHFSRVTVCVHASCLEKRYWIDAFERRGIPWVVGADYANANTLPRIRQLFSRFQFVTTNGFGSHLAYAAAFGAKVSIWGPVATCQMSDMRNDTLTINSPESTRRAIEFSSEAFLRRQYPDFFTDPWDAPLRVEWGREEIGWENRKSPDELKRIFGWDLKTRVIRGVGGRLRKAFGLGHR
jgi:hypothetical protein